MGIFHCHVSLPKGKGWYVYFFPSTKQANPRKWGDDFHLSPSQIELGFFNKIKSDSSKIPIFGGRFGKEVLEQKFHQICEMTWMDHNWVVVSNIFYFHPYFGRFPFWLIFFKGVEATNHHQPDKISHIDFILTFFVVSGLYSLAFKNAFFPLRIRWWKPGLEKRRFDPPQSLRQIRDLAIDFCNCRRGKGTVMGVLGGHVESVCFFLLFLLLCLQIRNMYTVRNYTGYTSKIF